MSGHLPSNHWIWPEEYTNEARALDNWLGFIYVINERLSGKSYFGRKQFWRRKKSYYYYDPEWEFYCGSSSLLLEDLAKFGKQNFVFRILGLFSTKTGMSLGEAKAIVCSGSLEKPSQFYNRAAPSIRGKLRVPDEDLKGLRLIEEYLNE